MKRLTTALTILAVASWAAHTWAQDAAPPLNRPAPQVTAAQKSSGPVNVESSQLVVRAAEPPVKRPSQAQQFLENICTLRFATATVVPEDRTELATTGRSSVSLRVKPSAPGSGIWGLVAQGTF